MEAILIILILIQVIAIIIAIVLIKITKKYFAWILVATAISLMAIPKFITLISILQESKIVAGETYTEYVALIITIFLTAGLLFMIPIFKSYNKESKNNRNEIFLLNKNLKTQHKELIIAKKKYKEGDQLISAFLSNMSHEIRTPLNGINGFVELIRTQDIEENRRKSFMDIIQRSCARLLIIIDDILDISKIESGQIVLHNDNTSIHQILSEQYAFFTKQKNRKDLKLSYKLGLPEWQSIIYTDKKRIIQVLSHLIDNALKFTEKGNVEFGYELKGEFLEFFVKDSGIGISEENFDKIFHLFRQIEIGLSRAYNGNGLGLSISKALVNNMGGKMWVESKLGKGSVFYFTIPYKPALPTIKRISGVGNQIVTSQKLNDKAILIAEDEVSNYVQN